MCSTNMLDGDRLNRSIERYGKEVAKNVRHEAVECLLSCADHEQITRNDILRAEKKIMSIQFKN